MSDKKPFFNKIIFFLKQAMLLIKYRVTYVKRKERKIRAVNTDFETAIVCFF